MFKASLPQPIVSHLSSQVGLMDTPAFPFKTTGIESFCHLAQTSVLVFSKRPSNQPPSCRLNGKEGI